MSSSPEHSAPALSVVENKELAEESLTYASREHILALLDSGAIPDQDHFLKLPKHWLLEGEMLMLALERFPGIVEHPKMLNLLKEAKTNTFLNLDLTIKILSRLTPYHAQDFFENLPHYLRENRIIALTAVGRNGLVLEGLSEELRNDKEIVLQATRLNHRAYQFASEALRGDREVLELAFKSESHRSRVKALKWASQELKADKEMVLISVTLDGMSLQYAAEELKDDLEIVQRAVMHAGRAIQFASQRLRSDRELALLAIQQDSRAFDYLEPELKEDPKFVEVHEKHVLPDWVQVGRLN